MEVNREPIRFKMCRTGLTFGFFSVPVGCTKRINDQTKAVRSTVLRVCSVRNRSEAVVRVVYVAASHRA